MLSYTQNTAKPLSGKEAIESNNNKKSSLFVTVQSITMKKYYLTHLKKCTLCIMINNKDLFDLIAWPLREKKKEKEEKEVCAKKKLKKNRGKGGNVSNQSREWHYI